MKIAELVRLEENFNFGTFGVLKIDKKVFCVTLEPADLENLKNKSSIPAQQYICKKIKSPKYDLTFEVQNVPGRDHILFHAGNIKQHTKGCILLGQNFGKLGNGRAVLNSGNTFREFMEKEMAGESIFHLTIHEVY